MRRFSNVLKTKIKQEYNARDLDGKCEILEEIASLKPPRGRVMNAFADKITGDILNSKMLSPL